MDSHVSLIFKNDVNLWLVSSLTISITMASPAIRDLFILDIVFRGIETRVVLPKNIVLLLKGE